MMFVGFLVALFVIANIVALVKALGADSKIYCLQKEVEALKERVASLSRAGEVPSKTTPAAAGPVQQVQKSQPVSVSLPSTGTSQDLLPAADLAAAPTVTRPTEEKVHEISSPASAPQRSLEIVLGTKWLNWVGMVMLLFGVGYFMKYAYDNAWIGPKGRLTIGVIASFAALVLGERFRRKQWPVLFQAFSGGALAALYLCVYFSFQVYHLSNQGIASFLAIVVTAFAVALAVAYNSITIEILALAGGFLSPVILSTGENHPYAFFTYIAILNLVAIATAVYRRWRLIDLLCLFGTIVMYVGWALKFYAPDQMQPALIFTSLFYLMFLLIPTIHGLINRLVQDAQGIMMILAACILSFLSYFSILYPTYRYSLGFIAIAQALLVFLVFYVWIKRVGKSGATGASLLSIALGLVTIAIPIQLELYGIPVAWAMEGVVLTYVGMRLKNNIPKIAGFIALGLSIMGLFYRLPLHTRAFTPVFNVAFGSWSFVVAVICLAAYLWWNYEKEPRKEDGESSRTRVATILALIVVALVTFLLNMELVDFWQRDYMGPNQSVYQSVCLLVLWITFAMSNAVLVTKRVAKRGWDKNWLAFSILYYLGAFIAFLFSLSAFYEGPNHRMPFVNIGFACGLAFVLSLVHGGLLWRGVRQAATGDVMESVAHAALAVLLALELNRWGSFSEVVTQKVSINLISVAWALQAFLLILIGLAKSRPLLRYLGFALFALAIGKILLIDTSELEKVYRIVSFIGCGLLLVAAGYFYQRYSARLVGRLELEKTE